MERSDGGQLLLHEDTPRQGRGRMAVFAFSSHGDRGPLLDLIPGMSTFHQEAW
ncbi:MAG: hypothetical protein ACKO5M_03525 [Vulcanococcus sp.]